jgi:hypothetical protein
LPLNVTLLGLQPVLNEILLESFSTTFSLNVIVMFILPGVDVSGERTVSETVGFDVLTVIDSAEDAEEVCELRFWVAVSAQIPSANVPKVQLAVPPAPAAEVVQVTLLADAFVAVAVTVAPSVTPVKSRVGVLSAVLLSVVLAPVSELGFRSGAFGIAPRPTFVVAVDATVEVLKTCESTVIVPVSFVRMKLPTSALVRV